MHPAYTIIQLNSINLAESSMGKLSIGLSFNNMNWKVTKMYIQQQTVTVQAQLLKSVSRNS